MAERQRLTANGRLGGGLMITLLFGGMSTPAANAAGTDKASPPAQIWQQIYPTRPKRREIALRDTNISDTEVEQIRQATRALLPGALVNIGAVTLGCPCQDGPACTEQVWIVAETAGHSQGLALSRIDSRWQIGPLQQWWLEYNALYRPQPTLTSRQRQIRREQARAELAGRFPSCTTAAP